MLAIWVKNWSNTYLRELYDNYRAPLKQECCFCQNRMNDMFRCSDCLTSADFCQDCLIAMHHVVPTHRILKWTGATWSKTTLQEIGLTFALGDHITACPQANLKTFCLGDTTGIHSIKVAFCGCRGHALPPVQLLQKRILPCSDDDPSTGFTFSVLRQFHFASVDAKLSSSRFYAILQRSANNLMPHLYLNRFREFIRATRQWMYLQDLKRSGTFFTGSVASLSLALRCPACPRLGVNFEPPDVVSGQEYA